MASKMKIRKGDKVMVISGRDRGKRGEVLRVLRKAERVLIQGVNLVHRHQRQTPGGSGGIIEKEAAIHVSNVALIDPKTDRPTRIGVRTVEGGRKVRVARRSGEAIDL